MKITEDYVSFEVATLLKEKGFDEVCSRFYMPNGHGIWKYEHYHDFDISKRIECPTIQMACKWLREVHNIFIEIYLPSHSEHEDTIYHGTYSFDIFNLNTKVYVYCTWNEKEFNSYEEAIEEAIKYTLENLI